MFLCASTQAVIVNYIPGIPFDVEIKRVSTN